MGKISVFGQNFDFGRKCRFWTKFRFLTKFFYFLTKILILDEISIFDDFFYFLTKILSLDEIFIFFRRNFLFFVEFLYFLWNPIRNFPLFVVKNVFAKLWLFIHFLVQDRYLNVSIFRHFARPLEHWIQYYSLQRKFERLF